MITHEIIISKLGRCAPGSPTTYNVETRQDGRIISVEYSFRSEGEAQDFIEKCRNEEIDRHTKDRMKKQAFMQQDSDRKRLESMSSELLWKMVLAGLEDRDFADSLWAEIVLAELYRRHDPQV